MRGPDGSVIAQLQLTALGVRRNEHRSQFEQFYHFRGVRSASYLCVAGMTSVLPTAADQKGALYVFEELFEGTFTFSIPKQLLSLFVDRRLAQLEEMLQTLEKDLGQHGLCLRDTHIYSLSLSLLADTFG